MKNRTSTLAGILIASMAVFSAQAEDTETAEEKVQLEGATAGQWTMDYDAALKLAAECGS